MHVLLIHQTFAALNEPGGTRHHELAAYLASLGHRVTVVTSPVSYLTGEETLSRLGSGPADQQAGVRILYAASGGGWHRSFPRRALSFLSFSVSSFLTGLRLREVDIVWGTSPPLFQGATAWGLAKVKRAAFIFEIRDLWPRFAVSMGVLRNRVVIRLSEWLEGFLYRRADVVVVNSPGYVDHVREGGARRVEVVPNGADVDMFQPQPGPSTMRQQLGLEGAFVVVYAGAHGMANDLETALKAAAELIDHPSIRFIFLGDGKEKPRLVETASSLGLVNVDFLPPVSKLKMPEVFAAADAGLAILKPIDDFKLTYPNKVFDYMAAGLPVVLAIDGAIRQVVEAAEAGVFVPPGDPVGLADALRRLASDPAVSKRMGRSGRAYVSRHFNRRHLGSQFEAILAETGQANAAVAGGR